MLRWIPVVVLVVLPLAGCGDDGTPARPAEVPSLSAAGDLGTPLPSGWPDVTFPEGTTINASKAVGPRLNVDFETQEPVNAVAAFLDAQLTGAGFQKGDDSAEGDTLTASYASGPMTAVLTLVDTGGTTTGTLRITTASASPSASGSPSASASPTDGAS